MRKQPAVIIIARHGARLDQADRNWHTTAENPYDPPLTYGGWIQCQYLGVRINHELLNLDRQYKTQSEGRDESAPDVRAKKKRKVLIHSSPYLRCVQTSIAIAAGIQHPQHHRRVPMRSSSRQLSLRSTCPPLDESPTRPAAQAAEQRATNCLGHDSCQLRLDAFLGEWLSPTYFAHACPPPPSAVLVSQAKMVLAAPQEEINGADLSASYIDETPAGEWEDKESDVASPTVPEKTGLRAMAALGHSLPKRPRNISFGTELANGARQLNKAMQRRPLGYTPPTPTYAIAPSDRIPPGFVAHARDACVDVDQEWDSELDQTNWGDGGPFDEEWSSMHRRFRSGLQKMVDFYATADPSPSSSGDDDEEDLVLIVVTHQAGCNALIRFLTGAPALHDVGLASLTMAVRKPDNLLPLTPVSPVRRRGSLDLALSNEFDMKIIASTEHLRSGSHPLGLSSPRLGKSPAFASRRAGAGGVDSPDTFSLEEPAARRGSSAPARPRSASQRSSGTDADSPFDPPAGLWRRGSRYSRDETDGSTDLSGAFGLHGSGTWTTGSISEEAIASDTKVDAPLLPVRSASQRGLWGGESIKRERSPGKRRWTAVDRSP